MIHTETSAAVAAFESYTRAFQSLDPKAVARHFHEPALIVSPKGAAALPTRAVVEEVYARIMGEMPQGYAGTKFSPFTEDRLGDDLVTVSGGGVWTLKSGEEIMPFGMHYTLRRVDNTWLIVAALIHAPIGK